VTVPARAWVNPEGVCSLVRSTAIAWQRSWILSETNGRLRPAWSKCPLESFIVGLTKVECNSFRILLLIEPVAVLCQFGKRRGVDSVNVLNAYRCPLLAAAPIAGSIGVARKSRPYVVRSIVRKRVASIAQNHRDVSRARTDSPDPRSRLIAFCACCRNRCPKRTEQNRA
jgi:hypothetical protein